MARFKFRRDFSRIRWKQTLWYNGLRAVCAGFSMFIIMLLLSEHSAGTGRDFYAVLLGYPLLYYFGLLPLGLLLSWFSFFFPLLRLVSFLMGLLVAVGDPWVFLLSRVAPKAVPVRRPAFFSVRLIYYVLSEAHHTVRLPPGRG